jgi:type IV secretory pathway TraG/TraD family ATPase VirD4
MVQANARHPAAQRLVDLIGRGASDYLQVISGVINDLEVWEHPGLRAVTAHQQLDLGTLFDRGALLVVGAPIHGGRTSEAASGLLLSQIINRLYRRFTAQSGRHVFIVIDEAARLTNRLRLEELLSVARRARVSIVLATQDVGQFNDGKERIAILGNCATYISLPGRSVQNAEYLLGRLGQRYQSSISLTHSPGATAGGLSRSSQIAATGVLGHREVLDPPWGERAAVLHSQPISGKPFLVDLTRPEFA